MKRKLISVAKVASVLSAIILGSSFVYYRSTGTWPGGVRIDTLFGQTADAASPRVPRYTPIHMAGSKSATLVEIPLTPEEEKEMAFQERIQASTFGPAIHVEVVPKPAFVDHGPPLPWSPSPLVMTGAGQPAFSFAEDHPPIGPLGVILSAPYRDAVIKPSVTIQLSGVSFATSPFDPRAVLEGGTSTLVYDPPRLGLAADQGLDPLLAGAIQPSVATTAWAGYPVDALTAMRHAKLESIELAPIPFFVNEWRASLLVKDVRPRHCFGGPDTSDLLPASGPPSVTPPTPDFDPRTPSPTTIRVADLSPESCPFDSQVVLEGGTESPMIGPPPQMLPTGAQPHRRPFHVVEPPTPKVAQAEHPDDSMRAVTPAKLVAVEMTPDSSFADEPPPESGHSWQTAELTTVQLGGIIISRDFALVTQRREAIMDPTDLWSNRGPRSTWTPAPYYDDRQKSPTTIRVPGMSRSSPTYDSRVILVGLVEVPIYGPPLNSTSPTGPRPQRQVVYIRAPETPKFPPPWMRAYPHWPLESWLEHSYVPKPLMVKSGS